MRMIEIGYELSIDVERIESIGREQGDTGPTYFDIIMQSGARHAASLGVISRAELVDHVEEAEKYAGLRPVKILETTIVSTDPFRQKDDEWHGIFHQFTNDGRAVIENEFGIVKIVQADCVRFTDVDKKDP